jgi:hypothetical protein
MNVLGAAHRAGWTSIIVFLLCERMRRPSLPPLLQTNLHAGSAINAYNLAIDPLAILTSKEADYTCDINGQTDTVERAPGLGVLVHLIVIQLIPVWDVLAADSVVHVGPDATGGDTVYGDLFVAHIYEN